MNMMMPQIVPAIYEKGALRPLKPLHLQEHQRVEIRIEAEPTPESIEQALAALVELGIVTPPCQTSIAPLSENQRAELARRLGRAAQTPLSQMIIEERR